MIALGVCLRANRFGADVLPDSGDYITAGIRLALGHGYSAPNRTGPPQPMTWFPPLFSVVIAGIEKCHWPIYRSVGIFNAGCYALLVAVAGMWVWKNSANRFWAMIAAAVVLTNHAVYLVHSIVLSEPLFLLWVTLCLWSVAAWRSTGKLCFAAAAGIAISLAMLTRYAGLSLLPAVVLIGLLTPSLRWKNRLAAIALMAGLGLVPSAAWSHIHTPAHQSTTGRTMHWHPITRDCIQNGIETLGGFALPEGHSLHLRPLPLLCIGVIILVTCGCFGRLSRAEQPIELTRRRRSTIMAASVFTLVYLAFLAASISLLDADTPLDERILSPLVVPLAVILCLGLSEMQRAIKSKPLGSLIGLIALLLIVTHWLSIHDELRQRQTAEDLAWFPTLQSDTLDSLRDIPASEAVWSDKPCAIYMAYRVRTDPLPDRPADPNTDAQSAEDYAEAIQILRDNINDAGGGWIVLWHQLANFGDGFLNEDDIRKNFVIAEAEKFDDGVLLRVDDPQATPTTQQAKPATQADSK